MRLPSSPAASGLIVKIAAVVLLVSNAVTPALAWGAVGHAIVATIAQTQLHPAVRSHLCSILPNYTAYDSFYPRQGAPHKHCHLATLASWPDTIHMRYPWSGHLHYINGIGDDPPLKCLYGEEGWSSQENLVSALYNYTERLVTQTDHWERDFALRFIVHLMGDMSQPLHLSGRARGGNDIWVRWEGRKAKLHSVWDSQMLQTQIRELANYTTPLPSTRIESSLQGKIWDNYIRWVLKEGLGQPSPPAQSWWSEEEQQTWLSCDSESAVEESSQQLALTPSTTPSLDDNGKRLCAMAWTKLMHPLACSYAFASPVPTSQQQQLSAPSDEEEEDSLEEWTFEHTDAQADAWRRRRGRRPRRPHRPRVPRNPPSPPHEEPPVLAELDIPEYAGRINDDKILQLQLAKAGVRLGALLNSLLLDEALAATNESV